MTLLASPGLPLSPTDLSLSQIGPNQMQVKHFRMRFNSCVWAKWIHWSWDNETKLNQDAYCTGQGIRASITKALFHVADLSRVYLYSRSVHTPPHPPMIETPSTCLYSTSCCFLCIYSFSCHCQGIHLLHCFALFLFGNGNYGTVHM